MVNDRPLARVTSRLESVNVSLKITAESRCPLHARRICGAIRAPTLWQDSRQRGKNLTKTQASLRHGGILRRIIVFDEPTSFEED